MGQSVSTCSREKSPGTCGHSPASLRTAQNMQMGTLETNYGQGSNSNDKRSLQDLSVGSDKLPISIVNSQ